MSKAKLKSISSKLKKASKAHAGQAKQIDDIMKKESSFKMKGFSGFKTSKLDMTLNNKLNDAVLGQQSSRHKKSFDKFQSQKQKGKKFVKNLIKKGGKFFSGKALGIAGMMMSTTGTALGSNKSLKSQEGAARRLFNKRKNK